MEEELGTIRWDRFVCLRFAEARSLPVFDSERTLQPYLSSLHTPWMEALWMQLIRTHSVILMETELPTWSLAVWLARQSPLWLGRARTGSRRGICHRPGTQQFRYRMPTSSFRWLQGI